ncbi:MAG: hypothetical protein NVS3B8_00140 [Chitinophagaceae bacterium]
MGHAGILDYWVFWACVEEVMLQSGTETSIKPAGANITGEANLPLETFFLNLQGDIPTLTSVK